VANTNGNITQSADVCTQGEQLHGLCQADLTVVNCYVDKGLIFRRGMRAEIG